MRGGKRKGREEITERVREIYEPKKICLFLYSKCRVFYIVNPMTGPGGEMFDDSNISSTTESIIYSKKYNTQ